MRTYEIERKLRDKVDKWELESLQTENRQLKNHINELERNIKSLQNIDSNKYYALERLFTIIAEHPQFSDVEDEIWQLKSRL